MAQRRALTAPQVVVLKKDGQHWVAPSLYLNIKGEQGTRSWLFRYRRKDGSNQWMGLGSVEEKSLSEARDEAAMLRVAVKRGEDPIAAKREVQVQRKIEMKQKVPTFAECAEKYIASHKAGWKNEKHSAQWPSTIEMYVNPFIGKMQVDQITVEDVLKVLKPIWTSKAETASRVRGRIESILGWAAAMGYRSGDNPAQWKSGALPHLFPATGKIAKVEHRKAVPYQDVPKLMAELRKNGSVSAKALTFTILTGARTTETREATHTEIDRKAKVWTIPAGRMKAGREHRVPLTDEALALLDSDPTDSKYLFPSPSGYALSNMAMLQLLRGLRDDGSTVHGFRSSFRDWAAEQTDFPREVVEACLAHALGDDAELAYKRTDFLGKRREVMVKWTAHCHSEGQSRLIGAGDELNSDPDRKAYPRAAVDVLTMSSGG
ncbi:MAG: integrase arm-type DNA-binding domain-containing protein [Devosia sp.]|uniref:tyrosine-type recombinase/integrase n=1 Tax=Devosia sp. TaxID=1871048 RepID=UPI001A525490|nr:site-specific integrase [Devosia sp.]MBL8600048.1 integrase arm-type DNA-binding domain-containing protein [Devosia sp.]